MLFCNNIDEVNAVMLSEISWKEYTLTALIQIWSKMKQDTGLDKIIPK